MRNFLAPLSAGFVTVLVGFTSSAAIVFQAAAAAGATPAQISSWIWALGLAMGLTCIGLSLRYRAPVVTAWSTPGAALLVTALAGVTMEQATGAFLFCALLILLAGLTRGFERVLGRIPPGIASAMLAGVLVRFGMEVFVAMGQRFGLVFAMFLAYLLARRWLPRYAVIIVLALGSALAALQGQLDFSLLRLALAPGRLAQQLTDQLHQRRRQPGGLAQRLAQATLQGRQQLGRRPIGWRHLLRRHGNGGSLRQGRLRLRRGWPG